MTRTAEDERRDMDAYLSKRIALYLEKTERGSAAALALTPRRREVEVILFDIRSGLHEGMAEGGDA